MDTFLAVLGGRRTAFGGSQAATGGDSGSRGAATEGAAGADVGLWSRL